MKNRYFLFITIIILQLSTPSNLCAVKTAATTKADLTEANLIKIENAVKHQKIGFLKKWVIKGFIRKIRKMNMLNSNGTGELEKSAEIGLFFAILSFAFLWLGLLAPILWIAAAILALVADIVCIRVLHKTGANQEIYKKARGLSKAGLIIALLTGIIPLTLLILVLVSL